MRLRRSTSRDLVVLLRIDGLARADAARRRWLREAVRNRTVYAFANRGRPFACGVLTQNFFQRPFIEMVFVAECERRKGFGSKLISRLEALGLRSGVVWTSTNQSNKAMRQLLKKHGFALRGRVSGLDEGDPELFYRRVNTATHQAAK